MRHCLRRPSFLHLLSHSKWHLLLLQSINLILQLLIQIPLKLEVAFELFQDRLVGRTRPFGVPTQEHLLLLLQLV